MVDSSARAYSMAVLVSESLHFFLSLSNHWRPLFQLACCWTTFEMLIRRFGSVQPCLAKFAAEKVEDRGRGKGSVLEERDVGDRLVAAKPQAAFVIGELRGVSGQDNGGKSGNSYISGWNQILDVRGKLGIETKSIVLRKGGAGLGLGAQADGPISGGVEVGVRNAESQGVNWQVAGHLLKTEVWNFVAMRRCENSLGRKQSTHEWKEVRINQVFEDAMAINASNVMRGTA
ncbi:hypothetical protein B0H17DRAFT_1153236 [Mycena rosella]|uniref:Uncharacterized protein n=1 Tax=Mycena rosella TaxID=1033263 RepID=A0AAD7B8B5_MYCRO|nr:hypothetical protein B0H17DRAFT_1153236 [Mycena rosella]